MNMSFSESQPNHTYKGHRNSDTGNLIGKCNIKLFFFGFG